jgi:hypothetical protein
VGGRVKQFVAMVLLLATSTILPPCLSCCWQVVLALHDTPAARLHATPNPWVTAGIPPIFCSLPQPYILALALATAHGCYTQQLGGSSSKEACTA